MDEPFELGRVGLRHGRGVGESAKKRWRHLIHTHVRALRRQDRRAQELEGVLPIQLAIRLGIEAIQEPKDQPQTPGFRWPGHAAWLLGSFRT